MKALLIAAMLILVGLPSCTKAPRTHDARKPSTGAADAFSIAEWVARLRNAFAQGGIQGYLRAKRSMLQQAGSLATDQDFHTAGLVFAIRDGDELISKERDLATRLRSLADAIERAPGKSEEEWRAFSNALISYSFGNSPLDRGSVAVEIVSLYADIAGTADN